MRYFIVVFILFPFFVLGQKANDSYDMYSNFLNIYKANSKLKLHFLVKGSTEYFKRYDTTGLKEMVKKMRNYLNGDKYALSDFSVPANGFADSVKKDSLWIPLMVKLDQKIKSDFIVNNKFSGVRTKIITQDEYDKYFKNGKNRKAWDTFHLKYSKSTAIIGFSEIADDGKRAVFDFESSYGDLGGEGGLVLFFKENSEWKFLMYLRIWQA